MSAGIPVLLIPEEAAKLLKPIFNSSIYQVLDRQ
jgi:hypothetical protein